MALNKDYWDYENANAEDWISNGLKYASTSIYGNPNYTYGSLDLSFPTSFRKRAVTKITCSSMSNFSASTVSDAVIYNSMIQYRGTTNQGSFYKDNILLTNPTYGEGYNPVIDIDTHDFAFKMNLQLFSSGNWISVNAVDFVNNYASYGANVYGYIDNALIIDNNYYTFCNFYDTGDSIFSVKANNLGTAQNYQYNKGGHACIGEATWSDKSIYRIAATTGWARINNNPGNFNMYLPYEIPEADGLTWTGNGGAPACLNTAGYYTNHALLYYTNIRVFMPLKHILRDIIVNSGLVLLDSTDTKWISMVDGNGLCQGKLVLLSSDEAKESSIYNIRTSDNTLNPNPPTPSGDAEAETFGWGGSEVHGMVRYYLLSQAEMDSLQSYMSNANWRMDYRNCVIGMYVVPNGGMFFDAPIPTTLKFRIGLNESGGVIPPDEELDTGISCSRITGVVNNDSAVIEIPRMNGNFLDYEPYSKYMVYIPFCGVVPLPDYIAGKEIKVTIYPDVPTCTCTAVVSSESRKIATVTGAFGSQLPLTSDGSGLKAASVINSLGNFIMGAGEVALGVGTGMVPLAIAGGAQMISSGLQTDLQLGQAFGYSIGASGDTSFFGAGNRCEYYIAYPKWNNPDGVDTNIYGHTYGFVVNKRGILGDFEGFTVCDNPHVYGFSCTSDEKDEIERLLSEGIIIHNPSE